MDCCSNLTVACTQRWCAGARGIDACGTGVTKPLRWYEVLGHGFLNNPATGDKGARVLPTDLAMQCSSSAGTAARQHTHAPAGEEGTGLGLVAWSEHGEDAGVAVDAAAITLYVLSYYSIVRLATCLSNYHAPF